MRNPARQLPDGVHFLSFEQLRERRFPLARAFPDPLLQLLIEALQLGGSFGDALLEFGIEPLELTSLAVQVHEHLNLGAQQFRDDGYRHIVDAAELVAPQLIGVGQHHCRYEYDGGGLKARMLANHGREFEAVEIGHAHVDENERDFMLEQAFKGLPGGRRFQQVFADLRQNRLVTQQLRMLIVDQQNIHRFGFIHVDGALEPSGAATSATPTAVVRCSRAWQDNPTRPRPGTSRGLPSWPSPSTPVWAGAGMGPCLESPDWFHSHPFPAS